MDENGGASPQETMTGTQNEQAQPEVAEGRRRLVEEWTTKVRAARDHFKPEFERMALNAFWATHGCSPMWLAHGKYRANIMTRYINRKVSELYATNPTVVAKRAKEIEGQRWDGKSESLQQAIQAVQMGDPILGPVSEQLLAEAEQIMMRRSALDKFAKTIEMVVMSGWDKRFKSDLKQAVRRALVDGVAWIMFDVYDVDDKGAEVDLQVQDTRTRVQNLQQLQREAGRETDEEAPVHEKLKLALDDFMGAGDIVMREGFLYSFPKARNVIIDPSCTQLRGLVGARWIAIQDYLSPSKVEAIYDVKVNQQFKSYTASNDRISENSSATMDRALVCVWRIFDKDLDQELVIADGHPDFLLEPGPTTVYRPGFWPVVPIIFNDTEMPEGKLYPLSDIDYLKDPQEELNRARDGLRTHRQANRPIYLAGKGSLTDEDLMNMMNVPTHGVVFLNSFTQGAKSTDILAPLMKIPIEPQLYDISGIMQDFQTIGGFQDANLGPTSGATATESSIAENSRSGETREDVDSLDETLSMLAHEAAVMAIWKFSPETVQEMAGPGAAWPTINKKMLAGKLDVSIRAGSSGRPNKAMELANIERVTPLLQTIPGINPVWLARTVLERLEDNLDIDEAVSPSLPSITALNALVTKMAGGQQAGPGGPEGAPGQPPTADQTGSSDPAAQGAAGSSNAPAPPAGNQGPQPAFGDSGALSA